MSFVSQSKAYDDGYAACRHEQPKEQCPHTHRYPIRRIAWMRGWYDCMRARQAAIANELWRELRRGDW